MIGDPFKYDWIENSLFYISIFLSKRLRDLNTPDLNMKCRYFGKMMIIGRSHLGTHFRCLRCFGEWIKPPGLGSFYQRKKKKGRYYSKVGEY